MKRREFISLIGGAAAWPLAAQAQQAANLPLVAVLVTTTQQIGAARSASIRDGLKQAGLIEGKDYVMTMRSADGDYARLPEIVKELDSLNPRVYVTVGSGPTPVHRQVPHAAVVFTAIAVDPVAYGWVDSYARPGGMTTGNVQNAIGGLESPDEQAISIFQGAGAKLDAARLHWACGYCCSISRRADCGANACSETGLQGFPV